jgi:FlaA1/EpsC-like NDP-sugar epimerase
VVRCFRRPGHARIACPANREPSGQPKEPAQVQSGNAVATAFPWEGEDGKLTAVISGGLTGIDWHHFLARPRLPVPSTDILDALRRERILVTGAGGSIGAALALRLAALAPPALVLLEASESRLLALKNLLTTANIHVCATFLLGDVADRDLLENIFAVHAPTQIFHAAAHKHVPLLEEQAFAAVQNNALGTATMVSAATARGARILLLSTDKAVRPASVMGATKRVAEQVVCAAGGSAIRLGNVLASRDSVAEVFARRLQAGESLTVTDPAARRYFLTIDEAVNLLLAASRQPQQSSILVPSLDRQYFITDLARFMARNLAAGRHVAIDFSGLGPGEKESEQLWASPERAGAACENGLISVLSPLWSESTSVNALAGLRAALEGRDMNALVGELGHLVPGYTPSPTVRRLASQDAPPRVVL